LEDRRACRIRKRFNLGGYRDKEKWPAIHDANVDAMIRLEKALKPRLAQIKV
jgi:hypothetical protein